MNKLVFSVAGLGSLVLLTACAPQTPVPVVSGYGQRGQVVARTSQSVQAAQPRAASTLSSAKVETQAVEQRENKTDVPVVAQKLAEPVAPAVKSVEHTVVASDTVYKLARTYQTSPEQILRDNQLTSMADLEPGRVLVISANSKVETSAWDEMKRMLSSRAVVPASAPAAIERQAAKAPVEMAKIEKTLAAIEPAAGERPRNEGVQFIDYTVQPKETIYRISLKYNVSVLDIMAANDFAEPQDLQANAVIKVPVKTVGGAVVAQVAAPVVESKEDSRGIVKTTAVLVVKDKVVAKVDEQTMELRRGQIDKEAARSRGLVWPVKGMIVRRFGDDGNGVARTGINIAVPKGTSVLASEGGTVLYADDGLKIYGKMVLVRHDNGMVSAYAHNSYLLVKKGEKVQKGQIIALSGASGNVESPQLHFELRQHASAIDPLRMLPSL